MNSVKILHCGDIHIGATLSTLGPLSANRRYETLLTFEKILNLAKEEKVDALLISGDLLDSNNIEDAFIDRVFEGLSVIKDIKVVMALGNHDPLNINSPFVKRKLPENVYILKTEDDCIYFEDINLKVYGRSFGEVYTKGKSEFSIPADNSAINIMCIHGELKSDLNSDYNAITPAFIEKSGMDYIALGHIHKTDGVLKLGGTHFAYSGCAEGQGFDELGAKGVYIGTVSKGETNLSFVPTAKRMFILEKIDITFLETNLEILNKINEILKEKYGDNYRENLYKIVLVGEYSENLNINISEILTRLSADVYFAKLRDKTAPKIDLKLLSKEKNLMGVFTRNMLSKIESAEGEEKRRLEDALILGLKAFSKEVNFLED